MCALFWGMCFFTSNKTNVFLKKEVKGLPRQMCVYHNRLCLGTKKARWRSGRYRAFLAQNMERRFTIRRSKSNSANLIDNQLIFVKKKTHRGKG